MYLLDTNVVSELRKLRSGRIDPVVQRWSGLVRERELHISAITLYELKLGLLLIERRDRDQAARLRIWLEDVVVAAFKPRTLPVTADIAMRCAALNVPNRRPMNDTIIAATAIEHRLTLVTRNVVDFKDTGVSLLNPWQAM